MRKLEFELHKRGLTQEEAAKKLGVSQSTVARHCTGKRGISSKMLQRYRERIAPPIPFSVLLEPSKEV